MRPGAINSWIRKQVERAWDRVWDLLVLAVAGGTVALFREPILRFLTARWTASMPGWQIALLPVTGTALFAVGWFLSRRALLGRRPPWDRYRKDEILGIRWAWSWPWPFSLDTADVSDVREIVRRLSPVCPVCGGVLYNPALDRSHGYIGHHRTDTPHVEGNEVKCMTCQFEHGFEVPYETVALRVASEVVRRARGKYLRARRNRQSLQRMN